MLRFAKTAALYMKRSLRRGHRHARRLQIERLESRQVLSSSWPGYLVHDASGDLFTVDIDNNFAVQYIGTVLPFTDSTFGPGGSLYGVAEALDGTTKLYEVEIDFSTSPPTINTTLVGTIVLGGLPIYVNSLEVGPDGLLYGAGIDYFGNNTLFSIDPDTAGAQRRFSLDLYESAGDLEFDEFGNLYLTTTSGDLLRLDLTNSSYEVVGNTGFADFFGLSYGPSPILLGYRANGEVWRINTQDASVAPAGFLSHPYLDAIYGVATVYQAPVDLGPIDYKLLAEQSAILAEAWYRVEPVHNGVFTVQVLDPANAALRLYEKRSDGTIRQLQYNQERLDYVVVGGSEYYVGIANIDPTFTVRLANLVQPQSDGLVVYGTELDDTLEINLTTDYDLIVNGVTYHYSFGNIGPINITFDGVTGHDELYVVGSARADNITIDLGSATAEVLSNAYQVTAANVPVVSVTGGGGIDSANVLGTASADTLTASAGQAELQSSGKSASVTSIREINVDMLAGTDQMYLNGSVADETLNLAAGLAQFTSGYYTISVSNCEQIQANLYDGDDAVTIHGTPARDTVLAYPDHVQLTGGDYDFVVRNYESLETFGQVDQRDSIQLIGQADTDEVLSFEPDETTLTGSISRRAVGFFRIDFFANPDDNDSADVTLSPSVADKLIVAPTYTIATSHNYYGRFVNAQQVTVNGQTDDSAKIFDGPASDEFEASSAYVQMQYGDTGQVCQITGIAHAVAYANSTGIGNNDLARLIDDETSSDIVYAKPQAATIFGSGYKHWAVNFETVAAESSDASNQDIAYLIDSSGNDTFVFAPTNDWAVGPTRLEGTDSSGKPFRVDVSGFAKVYAYSQNGGMDEALFYDSATGKERFWGTPEYSLMIGTGFYGRAIGFDKVQAFATASDEFDDDARLFDSLLDDVIEARPNYTKITFDGIWNNFVKASGFRYYTVYATAGGNDTAYSYGQAAQQDKLWASLAGRYALRYSGSFYHRLDGVELLIAFGDPSDSDRAYVFDSPGDDFLQANGATAPTKVWIASVDQAIETWDFGYVRADSSAGGYDVREVLNRDLLDVILDDTGAWHDG